MKDKAEWSYLLIQSPVQVINNYNVKLSMSGMNEIGYLNNLIQLLTDSIDGLNIDVDYDKHSLPDVFKELIDFSDELNYYLHGYKLSTSIEFFMQDPDLIYNECDKLAEEFTDKGYPENVEYNGFRLKKLCWLYGLLLKLSFLQGKMNALVPSKKEEVYSLSYKIAMLNEIGFFELPKIKAMAKGKKNEIIKILIGYNVRDIAGNIAALDINSKQYGFNYTSHNHIEEVIKLLNKG